VQGLSLPWITPVNLDQVIPAGKPVAPAPKVIKAPAAQRPAGGLAGAQLEQFKDLNNATTTFVSLLDNPDAADENLRRAQFRAGSYAWKGYADEAQRFTAFELTTVNGQLGKVHLVTNAGAGRRDIKVNLSGSKGTFPLTIANELNVSVRVGIVVTSANRSDLRIEPLETKVLAAGVKATFFVVGSRVVERPAVLIEEYMAGHEISVHTWSHHARHCLLCPCCSLLMTIFISRLHP